MTLEKPLTIATGKEVALLLFHTPTKYGSDRFRQIFIDHWEIIARRRF